MAITVDTFDLSLRSPETGRHLTANVYFVDGVTDATGAPRALSIGQLVMALCLDRAARLEAGIITLMNEMNDTTAKLEAMSQIEQEVARLRLSGTPYPESVTVKLNGEEIIANLVDDYVFFYGGTDATKGVDGTVAYYSIVGHSAFGSDSGVEEGTVWYFCFADENHNATWTPRKGWTGDSYE